MTLQQVSEKVLPNNWSLHQLINGIKSQIFDFSVRSEDMETSSGSEVSTEENRKYLGAATILYVEDDADVREQLSQFLLRRCSELLIADNGAAGLELFRLRRPNIVITDIRMPEMDGLEMAREIRSLDGNVPIVVTTAFEQRDYFIGSIDIGVDRYVLKPVNLDKVNQALLHCVQRLRMNELLSNQRRLESEVLRLKHLESLSFMAGGMSHDFNNLLQVILGYIALAKQNMPTDGQAYRQLAQAEEYSGHAIQLSQRLMGLVTGDISPLRTALVPFLSNSVAPLLVGTTITAEFDLPDTLPQVDIDELQMGLIICNLTVNAREAMSCGGVLRVSAQVCTLDERGAVPLSPGDYVRITFSDTGTGIAPHILPKIFAPYFSTKEKGNRKGMGLSLALCHAVISRHGGLITAESVPEKGASFIIHLPVAGGDTP